MISRELPISIDADGSVSMAALNEILAIMYFPDDLDRAQRLAAAQVANAVRQTGDKHAEVRAIMLEMLADDSQEFWRIFRIDDRALLDEAKIAAPDARIAARVLDLVLRLGAHLSARASVNNAVKIVCRRPPRSRSEVMKAWSRFKPVAHLWLAFFVFEKEAASAKLNLAKQMLDDFADATIANINAELEQAPEFNLSYGDNLLRFLSIAESIRHCAERHRISGAREALFAAGEAYIVPAHLGVVPSDDLAFGQLDDWMITEVQNQSGASAD